MTANRSAILAGISAGGSAGTALANFAPTGTTLPTSIGATLNAAFQDAGWITEDGLKRATETESSDVKAYGSTQPLRTLKTSQKTTFEIGFLESNATTLCVYHQLPLGTLVPDGTGAFDFTEGQARTQLYAAVFDIVDGVNRIRAVAPNVEMTGQKEFEAKAGTPIPYGVTLTAYPGSDGVSIHWYYLVPALAA